MTYADQPPDPLLLTCDGCGHRETFFARVPPGWVLGIAPGLGKPPQRYCSVDCFLKCHPVGKSGAARGRWMRMTDFLRGRQEQE